MWLLALFCTLPDDEIINADVRAAMKAWNVPGVSVVLFDGGRSVSRGYGLCAVGLDAPVTPDTLFSLGSCGKAFTATALGDLVAAGKMTWDDRVTKHLKSFRLADPLATRDVTVRDLLCHRTGLGGHELLWYRSPFTPAEAVRRAGLLPLSYSFRETFVYQSTMVTAAGLVAAEVDGKPWAEVIRTRVLQPLRMNATYLDTTSAEKGGVPAACHDLDADGQPRRMPSHRWPEPDAAGSIYSNAKDLEKWLRFQLSGDERLKETHTPQMVLRDTPPDRLLFPDTIQRTYGLGWVVYDHRGVKLIAHGGALEGHRCHIVFAPGKGVGVAVLANLNQTPLNAALSMRLLERLLGLEPRDWNGTVREAVRLIGRLKAEMREKAFQKAKQGEPLAPSGYAGTFEHPAYGSVRLVLRDGNLRWRWRDDEGVLEPIGAGTFWLRCEVLGEVIVTFGASAGTPQKNPGVDIPRSPHDSFTLSSIPDVVFRRGER